MFSTFMIDTFDLQLFATIESAADSTVITGTGDDDSIFSSGDHVTVYGGDGNDTINSGIYDVSGGYPYLDGGAGNDYLTNEGVDGTLVGGKGDDTLDCNSGVSSVLYRNGDGNDTIIAGFHKLLLPDASVSGWSVDGSNLILQVGDGSIFIQDGVGWLIRYVDGNGEEHEEYFGPMHFHNYEPSTVVTGSDYNDTIYNWQDGEDVSVDGGDGDDRLENRAYYSTIDGGKGNDVIYSDGDDDTLLGGDGNDLIENIGGSRVLIDGGAGNDTISNPANAEEEGGSDSTMLGGAGNDVISNWNGNNMLIKGGAGNDSIDVSDGTATIEYALGDGNDTIYKTYSIYDGLKNVVHLTDGSIGGYSFSGDNVVLNVGSGKLTFNDARGQWIRFVDADGTNAVRSYGTATLENTLDNVLIETSRYSENITNSGDNVTIKSGAGNDTLTGSEFGEVFLFGASDGRNVITNFGENDSLLLDNAVIGESLRSGGDFTLKAGSTMITLQGASGYNLVQSGNYLIVDGEVDTGTSDFNELSNAEDEIKVSGTGDADHIVNSGENVTIQGNGGDDLIEGSDAYGEMYLFASNHGNDTITNFDAKDTLKITAGSIKSLTTVDADVVVSVKGSKYEGTVTLLDAAGKNVTVKGSYVTILDQSEIQNDEDDIKVLGTDGDDYIVNSGSGVTIQAGGGYDTIEGSSNGEVFAFSSADNENTITNFDANDTLVMTAGNSLSYSTVGNDVIVTLKGAKYTGKVMLVDAASLTFKKSGKMLTAMSFNEIVNRTDGKKIVGTSGNDYITNTGENVSIQSGSGDDTIEGSDYGELYLFSSADGNNIITNFGKNDTLRCTAGSIVTVKTVGDDAIVSLKGTNYEGSVTLQGAGSYNFKQSGKYLYVNDVNYIVNTTDKKKVVGTSGNDYITNTGQNVSIQGGSGSDTIEGSDYGDLYLFSSADGDNLITNFGKNDTLRVTAGSIQSMTTIGNDVVVNLRGTNYAGTVTLVDTAGYDFVQSGKYLYVNGVNYIVNTTDKKKVVGTSGNDFITNTGQNVSIQGGGGNDTIDGSDYGEMYLFSSADGDNVIANFGVNDTIRITAGSLQSSVVSDDDLILNIKGTSYEGSVTLKDAAGLTLKQSGRNITAANVKSIVNTSDNKKVTGTSGADYIVNTGENVTIQSGAGNDTIVGSDYYGEWYLFASNTGNNVITNFGVNDTLRCTAGSLKSITTVGEDAVVSMKGATASGTVTLLGAGGYDFKQIGNYLTVNAVNTIDNSDDDTLIIGTSGRDYIVNSGENVTVRGSGGNDTMEGSDFAELYLFSSADGDDVITNFGKNDTLRITTGNITSYYASGSDYVVEASGTNYSGSVTLQNVSAISVSGRNVVATNVSAQLPSEDYWFEEDAAEDELNALLGDSAIDNSLAQLASTDDFSIASARSDEIMAIARHQSKK